MTCGLECIRLEVAPRSTICSRAEALLYISVWGNVPLVVFFNKSRDELEILLWNDLAANQWEAVLLRGRRVRSASGSLLPVPCNVVWNMSISDVYVCMANGLT